MQAGRDRSRDGPRDLVAREVGLVEEPGEARRQAGHEALVLDEEAVGEVAGLVPGRVEAEGGLHTGADPQVGVDVHLRQGHGRYGDGGELLLHAHRDRLRHAQRVREQGRRLAGDEAEELAADRRSRGAGRGCSATARKPARGCRRWESTWATLASVLPTVTSCVGLCTPPVKLPRLTEVAVPAAGGVRALIAWTVSAKVLA